MFSLTGDAIQPGSGPIAVVNYQSDTPYEALISLDLIDTILSDEQGLPIEHLTENGSVEVFGEEPPPEAPEAPTGLVAIEGDSEVVVSWNASFGASEYYVYRESQSGEYVLVAVVESTDFLDTDVINGTNYCYYVVASNVSGNSNPSNSDCA